MKKFIVLLLTISLVVVTFAGCGGDTAPPPPPPPPADNGADDDGGWYATSTDQFNLLFSVTTAETTAWGAGAQLLADRVYERTRGNVRIDVHFNEALAGGNQGVGAEMIMQGLTQLDARSNIIFTIMNENYGVITLPFMYESAEQARSMLMGPAGDFYRNMLYEDGLILLGFGENGMRQLTTNVPVHTAADLAGLRIRVPGMQLLMGAFEALGANPISMAFAEVFMALQQGAIDGQENPIDVIYGNLIHEVQDYITLWNYTYDALFFTINAEVYYSMPEDYRRIFREAGLEATEFQVELNRSRTEEQLDYFRSRGVTIITPTPEAMAEFRLVGDHMREIYSAPDRFGPELIDLFTP